MNDKIKLEKGDITKISVDAVVNAANSLLMGGAGVDGAIHKAAGPKLHEECMTVIHKMGTLPEGEAAITSAGDMPSRFVIHTVGPVWKGGDKGEQKILADAYRNSCELAVDFGLKTVAFPNISTGVYGYPKKEAAEIAINAVNDFLERDDFLREVKFVCFEDENYEIYREILRLD